MALQQDRGGLEGLLRPERHRLDAHDVADQELALERHVAERGQPQHIRRRAGSEQPRRHLGTGERPGEGGDRLQICGVIAGRRHDQQDEPRAWRVPGSGVAGPRDRRRRDAQGRDQRRHGVGPEVRQPRVRAEGHRILGPASPDRFTQPGGIGHAAVGFAGVHQDADSFLQRARGQGHYDPAAAQEVGESHILDRSRSTTSAGRRMIPMPAASNAASFSSAVPDEPEMIAPAWPMRRPFGAV